MLFWEFWEWYVDWQQTVKATSLEVNTYIEEVCPRSSKNLDNKVPKKSIFGACKTKLDNTFPVSHFHIYGYSKPYRLDRNRNEGGIIMYVTEDIQIECWQNVTFQIISKVYLYN